MSVLILGGTRFVGRRVAELLIEAGEPVTLAHRGRTGESPLGADTIVLDRSEEDGWQALSALRPDAVLDLSAYESVWVTRALQALSSRTRHYVFVSSGAVYRPSAELPWPETTPIGPNPIWGAYGREKVAAEHALREAHERGDVTVTVFRFPFVMGPGNYADREAFVCSRIEAGRPLLLPGGGSAVNQFVHVEDAARALVAALERPDRSGGEAFNCGYDRAITNRGFVELCATVLGESAEVIAIDEAALGVASPTVDLTDVVFPFPDEHYVLDSSRLRERLGFEARLDNRRMVEQFVDDWQKGDAAQRAPRRYAREERALEALGWPTTGRSE
jgi:nucleoside-diphosphate-sugar epimerase